MTNLTHEDAPHAAQSVDPFSVVTPGELRRAVIAALAERAAVGDKLAAGALKVVAHLVEQANGLAWQKYGAEPDHCFGGGAASSGGGCHHGEAYAWCECGCAQCCAVRAL